jgi:hypothetical protein
VRAVQAAPHGYQLVVGTTADAVKQPIYKSPLYNFATYLDAGRSRRQSAEGFPADNLLGFTAYAKASRDAAICRRTRHRLAASLQATIPR